MCQAAGVQSIRKFFLGDNDGDAGDTQEKDWEGDNPFTPQHKIVAADVPLGTGLAQQAKLSIMSRRAKLDAAIEAAEKGRQP